MRLHALIESPRPDILALIDAARQRFGPDELFYGNCGQFAWALAAYAQQHLHLSAQLAFLTNKFDDDGQQIDDPRGADIYHVMAEIDGVRYDGQGECSDRYIIQFAQKAYYKSPNEIELWTGYGLDAESEYIIRDGTDSSISSDQFLEFFESL